VDRRTAVAIALSSGLHGLLWLGMGQAPCPIEPPSDRGGLVPLRVLASRGSAAGSGAPLPAVAGRETDFPEGIPSRLLPGPGLRRPSFPVPAQRTAPATGHADRPIPEPPVAGEASPANGGQGDGPGGRPGAGNEGANGGGDPGTGGSPGHAGPGEVPSAPSGEAVATGDGSLREARLRYALEVRRLLSRSLATPVAVLRRGSNPVLTLRLRIREDGRVLEAIPETPCEDEGFCRRVGEAARDLEDLPSPPGGAMEIRVPVRLQPLRSR